MSRYALFKRRTLDRLTYIHQVQVRRIFRAHAESQIRSMLDSLDAGSRNFYPSTRGLLDQIEQVLGVHERAVIRVGVSDGIQEVSPEHRLGLWQAIPIEFPVEDSLGVSLGRKRDEIAGKIIEKVGDKNKPRIQTLSSDLLAAYLKRLREAFSTAAQDWLRGSEESSVDQVKDALGRALQLTDTSTERVFRTETTRYFNEARHDYFSENTSVTHMEIFTIADGRRSQICEDRQGWVVTLEVARLKKYMPPFHPNCRTIQRALLSYLARHLRIIKAGMALREREEPTAVAIAWKGAA